MGDRHSHPAAGRAALALDPHPPGELGAYKLELLAHVLAHADVQSAHCVAEPVAAAAQYASHTRVDIGSKLVMYDLGGGTFDLCVVEKTRSGFDILGYPQGIEDLGGTDLDESMFQLVTESIGDRFSELDPNDPATIVGLSRLRRDCVDAKESLSTDVYAIVPVTLPGLTKPVRITRREFETQIRPQVQVTVDTLRRALTTASVRGEDLTAVVLVGGSSRIPIIGELVQHELGVPVALDTHPKHDVALGAVRLEGLRTIAAGALRRQPDPTGETSPSTRAPDPVPPRPLPAPAAAVSAPTEAAAVSAPTEAAAVSAPTEAAAVSAPTEAAAVSAPTKKDPAPVASSAPSPPVRRPSPPPPLVPASKDAGPRAARPGPERPDNRPRRSGPGLASSQPLDIAAISSARSHDHPKAAEGRPKRGRKLVAVVAAGAATLSVVVAFALLRDHESTVTGTPSDGALAGPTATPSATPSSPATRPPTSPATRPPTKVPTTAPPLLPRADAPLPPDQLVWTRFRGPDSDIWRTRIDGKKAKLITTGSGSDTRPVLSPDRRSLLYVRQGKDGRRHLRVIAVDGSGDRRLFPKGPFADLDLGRPGWSPDGTKVASASQVDEKHEELVVLDLDGRHRTTLVKVREMSDPTFTPDGRAVTYWANKRTGAEGGTLMEVPADGSGRPRRVLAERSDQDGDPAWSPDGSQLAFRRAVKDNWDIWVVHRDGTHLKRLTRARERDQDPDWSPDGRRIVFRSARNGDPDLFVMAADGSGQRLVAHRKGDDGKPSWSRR